MRIAGLTAGLLFFIASVVSAASVPWASAVGVPTLGVTPSMIEKVENRAPRKRSKLWCQSDCIERMQCEGPTIGGRKCLKYCECYCNAKTLGAAKKCDDTELR